MWPVPVAPGGRLHLTTDEPVTTVTLLDMRTGRPVAQLRADEAGTIVLPATVLPGAHYALRVLTASGHVRTHHVLVGE